MIPLIFRYLKHIYHCCYVRRHGKPKTDLSRLLMNMGRQYNARINDSDRSAIGFYCVTMINSGISIKINTFITVFIGVFLIGIETNVAMLWVMCCRIRSFQSEMLVNVVDSIPFCWCRLLLILHNCSDLYYQGCGCQ